MNRQFFSELDLPAPEADLNVGAGTAIEQVSAIIGRLGTLFEEGKPDLAIVPGDTNSALAAGVACSKSGVPIAHLESGCRSGDFRMAEEVNRRLLDHMSQVLLCPTTRCVRNVRLERVLAGTVEDVGDTMYDSLLRFLPKVEKIDAPGKFGFEDGGFAFMTIHRAETVDDREALGRVLGAVAGFPFPVAFAVHPRTKARLREFQISTGSNLKLLDPLTYKETLSMVRGSKFVVTDSGGLQKEAYWLGRPSLIVRDVTEWGEIVDAGAAFLVGTDPAKIRAGYKRTAKVGRGPFSKSKRIFGRGDASAKVARVASKFLRSLGRGRV